MMRRFSILFLVTIAFLVSVPASSGAETLKVAHAYNDGIRELRHRLLTVMERELAARSPDVRLKIYPKGQLFAEGDILAGLQAGTLEMALIPLARLEPLDPTFASLSQPGIATTLTRAYALRGENRLEAMDRLLAAQGVRALVDVWLPGAVVSRAGGCCAPPQDLGGRAVYAASGQLFRGLETAGISVQRVLDPSKATVLLVTEVDLLDGSTVTVGDGACVVLPEKTAPWFDYTVVLISDQAWNRLSEGQQASLREAALMAQAYGMAALERAMKAPQDRASVIGKAGVQVKVFSPQDVEGWVSLLGPQAP